MADETYQGWTNYETWAVSLWINQDEAMYRYLRLIAKLPQLGIDKDKALREWVEGMNPLTDGSLRGRPLTIFGIGKAPSGDYSGDIVIPA